MGPVAILDRFQQIEPKVLVMARGYRWGGVWHDSVRWCTRSAWACRRLRT
jgi:hypothetical protein